MVRLSIWFLLVLLFPGAPASPAEDLLTVAERSGFRATARHADVLALARRIAARSPNVFLGEIGLTFEGRSIPLLVLSDPPVRSVREARRTGKPVVLAFANIHAGEVCGKEALLMLARELTDTPSHPLLKKLVVALAPIYNADGNERFSKDNRPGQKGPAEGMGIRRNAQGLDLNRDYVKLDAPETRALVRCFNQWDPAVIIDCHTTNGSYHRYALTYASPLNPAADSDLVAYARGRMLPAVSAALRKAAGIETFFYGNFSKDRKAWSTYTDLPREGTQYRGLRNRIGILSEAYAYDTYEQRIRSTLAFVRACLQYTADHAGEITRLVKDADRKAVEAGRDPAPGDLVPVRTRPVASGDTVRILGYEEVERDGKRVPTDRPRDYEVRLVNAFEPVLEVRRPLAYVFPGKWAGVRDNLERHGLEVRELREDIVLEAGLYRIDSLQRDGKEYQGHRRVAVEASLRTEEKRFEAGSFLVRTAQPLGTLAVVLLEPESADGLASWGFFEEALAEGKDYPVCRLAGLPLPPILTARARLPEDLRPAPQPITYERLFGSRRPLRLGGSPLGRIDWLQDGERYLLRRDGKDWIVEAATGKARSTQAPRDIEKRVAADLDGVLSVGGKTARRLAGQALQRRNARAGGMLFTHKSDLYFCPVPSLESSLENSPCEEAEGLKPLRLTNTPELEELASFSPDGKHVAFVREDDLWVVDVKTAQERRLTAGGADRVRSGKADWVYFEEVFNRNWKAYWWAPDSRRIAFLRIDSRPVREFVLANDLSEPQEVEKTPYPKPGEPNPLVRLGVAAVDGGVVRWADLSAYDEQDLLVTRVAWWPDARRVFVCCQNRTQTWLDVCSWRFGSKKPERLLRETTKAWVNVPPPPRFFEDGSFLLPSERDGWQHLYRFDPAGKLKARLTSGEWEVRSVLRLDEKGGWVYFTGTRDSPIASNLYRVRTDGSHLERLTGAAGSHRVQLSPAGRYFTDSWSNLTTPTRLELCRVDGTHVRTLDSNPAHERDGFRLSAPELLEIEARDGFPIQALLVKPPDFDPERKYPVWFSTYAGPHAPTIQDAFAGGRAWDQVLARHGILVFHCDPRSASGKGAVSAWTAYRRLGVQELRDIEDAIRWLTSHAWADASRVGISGHSYGGFMTAYAMTHSDLFSAGIAGAPVTDWRDYDSIYTERYMGLPRDNAEGYRVTSAREAASRLHGRLLLIHGLRDDNVHVQNTMRFVEALQKAGRQFELMVYPPARHGIGGRHYRDLRYGFMLRAMGCEPPAARPERPRERLF